MTERERIKQANEVADIVFREVKKAWPDMQPVLGLRYGVADALWAAGYRKQDIVTDAQVDAAARKMYSLTNALSMSGARDLARAALEAARSVS